jgi:hypothetical protein
MLVEQSRERGAQHAAVGVGRAGARGTEVALDIDEGVHKR